MIDNYKIQTGRYSTHTKGRKIKGRVTKVIPREKKCTLLIQRRVYLPRYQRYEKRNRKIHVHLLPELESKVVEGMTGIAVQSRPWSVTKHYALVQLTG